MAPEPTAHNETKTTKNVFIYLRSSEKLVKLSTVAFTKQRQTEEVENENLELNKYFFLQIKLLN